MAQQKQKGKAPDGLKVLARNKKALHNFSIIERFEAGVVLLGSEVKSIRDGRVSLGEAYARFTEDGELFLLSCHVAEYPWANLNNHDPLRPRKLLLNRRELAKLSQAVTQAGATIVPLAVYLKRGLVKVEVGIGKGKKLFDKREDLKKKSSDREIERAVRR